MKIRHVYFFIITIIIIGLEIFLRMYFGFCDAVLMKEDPDFEYIAQPSQNRFRFRNHIVYNSYSMRSDELDTSAIKILGFGDSVINGGVQVDQDSLATTILSDTLSKLYHQKIQFLNISSGSWGPDNCYAYLEKYGNFGSQCFFLFISSHDAFDNMNFEKIIDYQEGFPSKQYFFAIYEMVDRYLIPGIRRVAKSKSSEGNRLGINKKKNNTPFNSGFNKFLSYVQTNGFSLIIYLHPDQNELKRCLYNNQGQEIIQFAKFNNIPIILGLEYDFKLSDYRDAIHINSSGQRKIANIITGYIYPPSRLKDRIL
jgi:hypothetical protein